MALIEFEDLPSTDTPINATNLNNNFNEILNLVYPIGRGFIDFTDTDYSNYLGFTWERELVGLTPVGYDADDEDFDTIGVTGGEKTHTLTIDEMPSHTHYAFNASGGNIQFPAYSTKDNGTTGSSTSTGYATTVTYAGSNLPHNNMPPYKVVAYWKRTA